jgi:hypothetical protein
MPNEDERQRIADREIAQRLANRAAARRLAREREASAAQNRQAHIHLGPGELERLRQRAIPERNPDQECVFVEDRGLYFCTTHAARTSTMEPCYWSPSERAKRASLG